jgi:predicted Zn-dependent protease
MHLTAAQGWLELGNHEEAFEELEQIDATLRGHPDVLEVRWGIYASIEKWEYCLEIGSAMVRLDPARFTGWINRSFALHCLKRTKEAYEQLKEGLRRHDEEELIWYNLACYACVLGKKFEARRRLAKAGSRRAPWMTRTLMRCGARARKSKPTTVRRTNVVKVTVNCQSLGANQNHHSLLVVVFHPETMCIWGSVLHP